MLFCCLLTARIVNTPAKTAQSPSDMGPKSSCVQGRLLQLLENYKRKTEVELPQRPAGCSTSRVNNAHCPPCNASCQFHAKISLVRPKTFLWKLAGTLPLPHPFLAGIRQQAQIL